MSRTVLVTGGNRGIGKEVSLQLLNKGLRVILTGRDLGACETTADELQQFGIVLPFKMDVADPDSVESCAVELRFQEIDVHILINNAGELITGGTLEASNEDWKQAIDANLLGAIYTCRAFVPGMVKYNWGRVVNVTSGYGLYSEALASAPATYGVTKAALNAFTFKLAQEVPDTIKVNAVSPGWVRTRMGGDHAPRSVEEGAYGIVRAALLSDDGPTGQIFRDDKRLAI